MIIKKPSRFHSTKMRGLFTISKANENSKSHVREGKIETNDWVRIYSNVHRTVTVVTYKHAKYAYGNCNLYHKIRDALFTPTQGAA